MNIFWIQLYHSRVISDCFSILSQFRIAISPIVKSLNIAWRSILYLIAIVINSFFKMLKFSVDESSIGVYNRVLRIKFNSFIKVLNTLVHLSHVPKATGSIVPVNSICIIKFDSFCKIVYRFFEIKESIPNKTATIIGRCILFIKLKNLIKVF